MKAIVQDAYGSADMLTLRDVDRPVPAAGEVLVRVRAASLNARDWHVMRGDPKLARLMDAKTFGSAGPKVAIGGTDFAGEVEAVGSAVDGLRPGDEVYGEAPGAFAEYISAPAGVVGLKPVNLSFEQAAAMPLAGTTALAGLRGVHNGQTLLVNGASGGVGTFAVQIAKALGVRVTAVCSTRNVDLLRSLGADRIVDYTREDFTRGAERYDMVFDLVGNRSLRDLRRVLAPTGRLVLSGGGVYAGGSLIGPVGLILRGTILSRLVRKQRIVILTVTPSRAALAELRELAEAGRITPAIDRTYPLSEAAAAMRYLEGEHARAKVVLRVSPAGPA